MSRQTVEHPILFSEVMLRAILAKKKTMTRRVLSGPPYRAWASMGWAKDDDGWPMAMDAFGDFQRMACPYGEVGDLLWVKHTFWHYKPPSTNPQNEQAWDEVTKCARWPGGHLVKDCTPELKGRWRRKPSIFMPRWASRALLQVTGVRFEKLQKMTDEDAVLEGIPKDSEFPCAGFKELWNDINGERGFGWDKNPSVWVVSFKVKMK